MSNEEFEFILDAIEFVAVYGHRFLPLYCFNWNTGSWTFIEKDCKLNASFCQVSKTNTQQKVIRDCKTMDEYAYYLEVAKHIGNMLPQFPSQGTIPKEIDANSLFFQV